MKKVRGCNLCDFHLLCPKGEQGVLFYVFEKNNELVQGLLRDSSSPWFVTFILIESS